MENTELKLQPAITSVKKGSARRDSEKMKKIQTDEMRVLTVPLHVRLCWCTFESSSAKKLSSVKWSDGLTPFNNLISINIIYTQV